MKSDDYRQFLVKIKQAFQEKTKANKTSSLAVEEVAQLLCLFSGQEPRILREFLLKATGKFQVGWDDLLQYLQQDISLLQTVKRLQHCPQSSTEIIESHVNDFGRLVAYVKQKQTNMVQNIVRLPAEVAGEGLFLACMDKEMVVFDSDKKVVVNSFCFRYSKMKEKVFEREEQRRLHRERQSLGKTNEYLDKVEIINFNVFSPREKRASQLANPRLLTSNFKGSVRGSSMSSDKSTEKMLFRKHTESLQMSKKRNQIRVKNDDIGRLFQIFEQASLNNSITVAYAFTEARSNFHKHITLDKSVLQKDKKDDSYCLMSEIHHNNYDKELRRMRFTSQKLNKMRTALTKDKGRKFFSQSTEGHRSSFQRDDSRDNNEQQETLNDKQYLQIVGLSVFENYLLVSLFNREIRLLSLKKTLNVITSEVIFERQFRSVVTYLELYRSTNSNELRILLTIDRNCKNGQDVKKSATEEAGATELAVYTLDSELQIQNKTFEQELQFSAKYQSALPFGGVLFNERGNFAILELNSTLSKAEEGLQLETTLSNPETNYKVSIVEVRVHRNMVSFYLCCNNGYVYLFDRLSRKIKYLSRANTCPVLDMLLIREDTELIALYKNGNIAILSSMQLSRVFIFQSYHEVLSQSRFLSVARDAFYVFSPRHFTPYLVSSNQEKEFLHQKPLRIFRNRNKLKNKSRAAQRDRAKVYRVVEGKGGAGHFLALLLEQGEISLLDSDLNYIGSYHYLNVRSIVELCCNESNQFIAILSDDNSLEVANLYTQTLLFTVSLAEGPNKKASLRGDSMLSSMGDKSRGRGPKEQISVIAFFRQDNPQCFLGLVTQANLVYHYSEKGAVTLSLPLEKRCGKDLSYSLMLYHEDCLVLVDQGQITVLHKQSYYKKGIISVSQHQLLRLRTALVAEQSYLLCIDAASSLFLVDTHLKQVKLVIRNEALIREDIFQFNLSFIFRQKESISTLQTVADGRQLPLKTDLNVYIFCILGSHLIRVSKQTGKTSRYQQSSNQFQDFQF